MESPDRNKHADDDANKHSELDLIPTKITALIPDPVLFVTPEKRTLIKLKRDKSNPAPESLNSDVSKNFIVSDPALLVTPEKSQDFLKSNLRVADKSQITKPASKNKVRFNVPDSSDDTTAESLSLEMNTELEETSSSTDDATDFPRKAGLYTQRNPLADITIGSSQTFDSSSSTETSEGYSGNSNQFSSTVDSSDFQQNFSKILDMNGKRFTQKGAIKDVEPIKDPNKTLITIAGRSTGHRQKTSAQTKIDKLTIASQKSSVINQLVENERKTPCTFLKKKSGLQRHQHSIKYMNREEQNKIPSIQLEEAQYNSSVIIGQKLQSISEQEFDANKAVAERLETDSDLKSHVLVKASEATNVDPDECVYKNLISVDASLLDVVQVPEFRRIKRLPPPKIPQTDEPNIMDSFPRDLIQEKITLDSRCYNLPSSTPTLAPLDAVMSLYSHSLGWSSF